MSFRIISGLLLVILASLQVYECKELDLLSEQETNMIMSSPDKIPKTYFLLLCYQKDIKCGFADDEITKAIEEINNSPKLGQIASIVSELIAFRRVECIMDYQRKLCNELGHGHQLKPARLQILPSEQILKSSPKGLSQLFVDDKKGSKLMVYKFTSPIQKQYVIKKAMMFTIPSPWFEYSGDLEGIANSDDVRESRNVIFLLQTADRRLLQQYSEISAIYRERFYFMHFNQTDPNSTNDQTSTLSCIGYNFTESIEIEYNRKNPALSQKLMEEAILEFQFQDLLVWDFEEHIQNKTYVQSLQNKLIVVGLAGKITNYLTTDFLYDFRRLAYEYRYSLNKYEFAILDIDDEQMFNYLISYNLGRFDSPGIFVINDMELKEYYRNYEVYDGEKNFRNISFGLISQILKGEKQPLYADWINCYKNLVNLEHWNNNRLKAYMYFLGVLSTIVLPIALVIDCFYPLFGRGPHHKKKSQSQASTEEQSQNKSQSKQSTPSKPKRE